MAFKENLFIQHKNAHNTIQLSFILIFLNIFYWVNVTEKTSVKQGCPLLDLLLTSLEA